MRRFRDGVEKLCGVVEGLCRLARATREFVHEVFWLVAAIAVVLWFLVQRGAR